MPFIKQERRDIIEREGLDGLAVIEPGDGCYVYYKAMVDLWKEEPKWRTVHAIAKSRRMNPPASVDELVAQQLAWEVFFALHVVPYEEQARTRNGDIK